MIKKELETLLLQKLSGKTVDVTIDPAGHVLTRKVMPGGGGRTLKIVADCPDGSRREVTSFGTPGRALVIECGPGEVDVVHSAIRKLCQDVP